MRRLRIGNFRSANEIFEAIQNFPNVESLRLGRIDQISDSHLRAFDKLRRIKELECFAPYHGSICQGIIGLVRRNPMLELLTLWADRKFYSRFGIFDMKRFKELVYIVKNRKNYRKLVIEVSEHSDEIKNIYHDKKFVEIRSRFRNMTYDCVRVVDGKRVTSRVYSTKLY